MTTHPTRAAAYEAALNRFGPRARESIDYIVTEVCIPGSDDETEFFLESFKEASARVKKAG